MIDINLDQIDVESVQWSDDKFIWDLSELEYINKKRSKEGKPKIEIVKKHEEVNLGIRAHPEMTIGKSLKSVFLPHNNEFVFIWLYLAFAVTFWTYFGLALAHDNEVYGYHTMEYYNWMLIATFSVAVSVTFSLVFVVFYSISNRSMKILDNLDSNFKVIAIYSLVVVFLYAEQSPSPVRVNEKLNLMELLIYLTASTFVLVIIFSQFPALKSAAWWVTLGLLVVVFFVDFLYASA
jgi:hypothetical protein